MVESDDISRAAFSRHYGGRVAIAQAMSKMKIETGLTGAAYITHGDSRRSRSCVDSEASGLVESGKRR